MLSTCMRICMCPALARRAETSSPPSALALREAVLCSVLVTPEAHVEDARLNQLVLFHLRLVTLAHLHGVIPLLLRAVRDCSWLTTGSDLRRMVEEQLVCGNPLSNPGLDGLGAVVHGIIVEVSAEPILPTRTRDHGDPDVEVVRPTHDLQVNAERKLHVHNVLVQMALGIVTEVDAMLSIIQGRGEGLQDGLAIHRDLPILHGPNHNLVASNEVATHSDLVRGGQAV